MTTHHHRHRRHSEFTFSDGFLTGAATTFVCLIAAVWISPTPADPPARYGTSQVEILPSVSADSLAAWELGRGLDHAARCRDDHLLGGL